MLADEGVTHLIANLDRLRVERWKSQLEKHAARLDEIIATDVTAAYGVGPLAEEFSAICVDCGKINRALIEMGAGQA